MPRPKPRGRNTPRPEPQAQLAMCQYKYKAPPFFSFLGISHEGGKALSSHPIWTFIPSVCPYVRMSVCPYVRMSVCPYVRLSIHPYVPPPAHFSLQTDVGGWMEWTSTCDEMIGLCPLWGWCSISTLLSPLLLRCGIGNWWPLTLLCLVSFFRGMGVGGLPGGSPY
jgi:hypothetical protein